MQNNLNLGLSHIKDDFAKLSDVGVDGVPQGAVIEQSKDYHDDCDQGDCYPHGTEFQRQIQEQKEESYYRKGHDCCDGDFSQRRYAAVVYYRQLKR